MGPRSLIVGLAIGMQDRVKYVVPERNRLVRSERRYFARASFDLFGPFDLSLMLFELFFSVAFRFTESCGHDIKQFSCIIEIGLKLFSYS